MVEIGPDALGTAATFYGIGAAMSALLQAREILRRGSSSGVSARFLATYAGGYAVWLLYGLSIASVPLILVDLVGLLCGGITLAITLAMRGAPRPWRCRLASLARIRACDSPR
jgi:uncharacterized protein with PQ loop repeat